jgi:hypothetical protein
MRSNHVAAIHVWRDDLAAADRNTDDYYSVSVVDSDDDEIRCIGGSKSLARAWKLGCEAADDEGVECLEFSRAKGEVTDRYIPTEAAS